MINMYLFLDLFKENNVNDEYQSSFVIYSCIQIHVHLIIFSLEI